jgi:solute carrier family 25 2-oxodicarboxylate transporter 21
VKQGFVAEAVGIIPKSSGMYATYELAKIKLVSSGLLGDGVKENFSICALAGFCSGISEALIVTPTQVVKVRLQAKEHLGKYKNSFDCLSKVVKQEGLSALSIGLGPTLFRNCVWNTVYFASMFWLKEQLPAQEKGSSLDHLQTLGAGFVGAMFATCFNAPFDVVKSRVQSQLPVSAATGVTILKYRNTLQTLGLIYREEGLAACYKGFQPKAIRMGLGGAVGMVTFEFMKNFLNE